MLNLSINQALTFWDELVSAYHGDNPYGDNVAEIYLHSMLEHCNTFAHNPKSTFVENEIKQAKENMIALIRRFEQRYNAVVIEDYGFRDFGPVTLNGVHRFHLKVVRKEI
jgi:hypothetical protein